MHEPSKQVVVFFVGPDMCGKTEISKAVAAATGIPYFKASSEHDSYLTSKTSRQAAFMNQLRYADPRVFDLLKQTGHSVIFDRGFPCEWAYSKVMNRPTDQEMLFHMDDQWSTLNTKVVLCRRSSYSGIVDDLDSSIKEEILKKLDAAYHEFACWTSCSVYNLNVDDEDLNREVAEVVKYISG